jgi:hypothetical protein
MRKSISVSLLIAFALLAGCKKDNPAPLTTRTYNMGFQSSAPSNIFSLYIQSLQLWTLRADAAMISTEVPWDSLLSGEPVQKYVAYNYVSVVNYYRQQNLKVYVFVDPENGLDRSSDSNDLVTLGKSIADADVQKVYRRFVVVMDSMLHPDHLGLALETNLIRLAATPAIYNGVKTAANAAVADVRAVDANVKISISVQADLAWGKLTGSPNATFVGVDQDFTDFPFIQEMGISSYPYFSFSSPNDIPIDYYSKLVDGKSLPVFVSEGGWTSQTFTGPNNQVITSSTSIQQDYITKQSQLLDNANATAWFQLTFTDIDLSTVPSTVDADIAWFAYLGLVDINLQPKPALTTWDAIFKRTLK